MDARSEYESAMAIRPAGEVITAHRRALAGVDRAQREVILDAVRTHLLTGSRHTAADLDALARFIACAEMRRPGSLLDTLETRLAERLRRYVVVALPVLPTGRRPPAGTPSEEVPVTRRGSGWDTLASDPAYQRLVAYNMLMCVGGRSDLWRRRHGTSRG